MKKVISLILVCAVLLSFVGCDYYQGKRRVVGMTYESEVFNGVQNQECINGLKLLAGSLRISYYENTNKNEFKEKLETIIKEGHNFIWCFEQKGEDIIIEEAKKNPEKLFGVIDGTTKKLPDNVVSLSFRTEEGGFLAGYVAEKVSQNKIIGFLGGEENEAEKRYEYGFKAGVMYAAAEDEAKPDIKVVYTGNDFSKEEGKKGADKLYSEYGCDILFHATQLTGLGAIEKARELNKFIIGSGSDQATYATNNVVMSIVKNVKTSINTITTKFEEKEDIGGTFYSYGIKERAISMSKTNVNLDREIYKNAMDISRKISKGEITPPKNREEYDEFVKGM